MSNYLEPSQIKALLDQAFQAENIESAYLYPVTDEKTDENLESQDTGMRQREQALYTNFLDNRDGLLVDFGCGKGANFGCFDSLSNSNSLLLGLEPDPSRAHFASRQINLLQNIEGLVVNSGISFLNKIGDVLKADSILCSQVLGHVPTTALGEILEVFANVIATDGQCLISVPVVGEAFARDPSSNGWERGSDYLHLVHFDRSPFEASYREKVSIPEFDQAAELPSERVLPVRGYWLDDFPADNKQALPIRIDVLPATFQSFVEMSFDVDSVFLYSIHEIQSREAGVGDVLMVLKRK